jgi:3-deoxy-D-manno-octulosonic acid kinase
VRTAGPASLPPGFAQTQVGDASAVAREALVPAIAAILARTTLYEYAATHPARRARTGRAAVYLIPLDGSDRPVVVRHSWHGGLLAPITGDRFLPPTRAPYELAISLRLAELGVPTPMVVAYAIYAAGPLLRRSDVVTEEIPDSADLADVLSGASAIVPRLAAVNAASALLVAMGRAGVRHPDLNLKNILVARAPGGVTRALLLDVDRVYVDTARARAAAANAARLMRSARKWRDRHGASITDAELLAFEGSALGGTA